MSKLKSTTDVIERYWPDFLSYCMHQKRPFTPTLDKFWYWYITDGPMGTKHKLLFYNRERVEYV